jgi:NhaA family Na+:H+ antiporter
VNESFPNRPVGRERGWLIAQLQSETSSGLLLLAAALIAIVWANSPSGDVYQSLMDTRIGPNVLGLDLTVSGWAKDGLLAIFFFVVGLELKHELVLGSLSRPAEAIVPVMAAIGGMVVPAAIFLGVNAATSGGVSAGWGIPMATDIAFALAVLAVVGRTLPLALRAFLLTLAVVDDIGAITVIAVFYSHGFNPWWLLGAILGCAAVWFTQRRRWTHPLVLIALAVIVWICVLNSGVHATIAGVALGLLVRVRPDPGETSSPADRANTRIHPISALIAVPVFAFCAAGVDLRSVGLLPALATPVAIGVIAGLVIGKPIGVIGATWLTARFTRARLAPGLAWADVFVVGLLAGIGFTVALLIAELAFDTSPGLLGSAKTAVLAASVISAVLAAVALLGRNRHYAVWRDDR